MSDSSSKALLPDGLRDALPPDAAHEAAIVEQLLLSIGSRGYDRVDPPLVEFEDSLLEGAGQGVELATFRLMDPVSQRMMGVRADMTPQVARIAATRLGKAARPLRLAYAGPVLRVRGDQLRPERQFYEVGVELIGADQAEADIEIIALAADALMAVGVQDVSVDINLPTLTPSICAALDMDAKNIERARLALDRKDTAAVASLGGQAAAMLGGLLAAAGPMEASLAALSAVDLPPGLRDECARLGDVARRISQTVPNLAVTIDPVENRGFEYHTGLSFTLFAKGVRGSLGRGGRYVAGSTAEPAIGFTLFLDSIARAVPIEGDLRRVFLPFGTDDDMARSLRQAGWSTLAGLEQVADDSTEALRLQCTHVLIDGNPVAISQN